MFASDTAAPAHPAVLEALARANHDFAASYGADALTVALGARLKDLFETDCAAFLVTSGTAANALALAALCPPWGAVICGRHAHVAVDEGGAPEFFTGGGKLLTIDAVQGKLTPEAVAAEAGRWSRGFVHGAQPFAVSITQASESGTSYRPADIEAVAAVAREHGLALHMDGARFANALAFTGATPAALTWRSGVSLLSLGLTKAGAMGADVIVAFDRQAAMVLPHLLKRAGQLPAKQRYLAAQALALVEDGLWLDLASHANACARRLASALRRAGADILHPVQANAVFARLPAAVASRLQAAGIAFHPWAPDGPEAVRFVASWSLTDADLARAEAALSGG